jgi:hypothetical protein
MWFLEHIRPKYELILCAIAHNSGYLLNENDSSIKIQQIAWLYRKDIHVMKTNQCSGGGACIYSNMAADSTRPILRIAALDL